MTSFFHTILHPAIYHGHKAKAPFFEGWYFKLVSSDGSKRLAVIPGAILGADAHAFVQVLDGVSGESAYHRYPLSEFNADHDEFHLQIGPNRFNLDRIQLQLPESRLGLHGEVRFKGITPWPVTMTSPGIMGWYAWVPFMECYHGVLSLDHTLEGALRLDQKALDFSGGHGYIEKDGGKSFPRAWVWFQSNHFNQPGTCITASVAIIPWLRSSFPGFIIGLWHNQHLYRFATYTGAKIESLEIADERVTWTVVDRTYRLQMSAERAGAGLLLGPTRQDMGIRVAETLNARVDVHLSELNGRTIFQDQGQYAGLEVHNPTALL